MGHRGNHWRECSLVAVNALRNGSGGQETSELFVFSGVERSLDVFIEFAAIPVFLRHTARMLATRRLLLVLCLSALPALAIDREYLAAWERAQSAMPSTPGAMARIAPAGEPGAPLTIRGKVVDAEGRAIRDAIVFAYHTDANGVYDKVGTPPHSWRLRGWARTDARGTFTFETIRPAPYPNLREPAHVHFSVTRSNGQRYHTRDLKFADGDRSAIAEITLTLEEAQRF